MVWMRWFVLSVEREADGFGVERGAIVKGDTAPEMKRPGESIFGAFPCFGEAGLQFGIFCFVLHEGIVNIVADFEGFAVHFVARV